MRPCFLALTATLVLATSPARADDKAVAAIQKQEAAATSKCAADLVKSAKALAALKAFEEARDELRLAMTVAPADAACRKEYAKLLASRTDTPDAAAAKAADMVAPVHAACATTLATVLAAWDKADRPEEFAHLATAAAACFEKAEALKPFDLTWHEPLLAWTRKKDVERWEKGDQFVDGAWADAAKVATLDAAHATWKSPWIVGDGVHEIRTTMPLASAKRALEYVRNWRRFVIDYFAGEWEWKQPKGPLPIYLTATQADYQARLHDFDPRAPQSKAAAIYLQRGGGLSPVFVTFEPNMMGGGVTKIDWPSLVRDLRHETAHQLLFESCMAQGGGVGVPGTSTIDWVSEGVANFLACHEPHEGRWRLGRHEQEPYGTGFEPGPFAWTRGNFEKVPPLAKYFTEYKANLDTAEDYFIATTMMYFLLEGADLRLRASTIKLLTEVHMARSGPKSFGECFGKVDFAKMQDEWKAFVDGISIEKR